MLEIFADVIGPSENGGRALSPEDDPTIAIVVATAVVAIIAIIISITLVQKSSKKNGGKSR